MTVQKFMYLCIFIRNNTIHPLVGFHRLFIRFIVNMTEEKPTVNNDTINIKKIAWYSS